MGKNENKMHLPSLDDIFTTQKERDEADLEKVVYISIKDIDDFPNHPFKILENEDMYTLRDSIIENGVLVPILLRPKENGRYEVVSGHRRKYASQLANKETIPSIVRDLTDDEATIIMVDSNMQREKILPSEKAFAYKMKLKALNHQGKRTDLTSDQVGPKLERSNELLSKEVSDSVSTIKRFIRLTELIPELLEMVDTEKIALSPAVELSFLKKEEQYNVLDYIECNDCTPSHSQAIKLKNLSQLNQLDEMKIEEILSVEKPNQVLMMKFHENRIRSVLPKNIEKERIEDYVITALKFYGKYLLQKKEQTKEER